MFHRKLRRQFERDGYVIVDPGVPDSVLDAIITDLKDLYQKGPHPQLSYRDTVRIQDAWQISAHVHTLAIAPWILKLLRQFYGRRPLPFQTLNFRIGTEQRIHSDTIHFNSMPAGYMCGVWVALEPIDLDNGPLVYYPGSHRLPEYTMVDVGAAASISNYGHYEAFLEEMVAKHQLRPHYATLQKGQALIWAANLLHGGAPQKDRGRTRFSQVTHFYFEGCKYYTPLCSAGEQISWRDPHWVPTPEPTFLDKVGSYWWRKSA